MNTMKASIRSNAELNQANIAKTSEWTAYDSYLYNGDVTLNCSERERGPRLRLGVNGWILEHIGRNLQ